MFCPDCGEKLPDDSKFCSACGTDVTEFAEGFKTGQDGNLTISKEISLFSKRIKTFIGIVVIVIIAVFAGKCLFSNIFGNSNAYVYLSDGKYELVTNLKQRQSIEVASSKSDSAMSFLLAFSPDGKYIYYYTKYDKSTGTGSLCKAEYRKLKANSRKNEKYIEVIATNIFLGFQLFDNGTVIYRNANNNLFYYNNKESGQIAKGVNAYYIDGSDRIIYVTGDYAEGNDIYGVSLHNMSNKVKLASNYSNILSLDNFDNIFYIKRDNWDNASLYVAGFDKDSKKIGDHVNVLSASDDTVYFTAENGTTLSLYDYVTDNYKVNDAGITEPDKKDYEIPVYSYDMITGSNLSEKDYDELYTSCTESLYWYGENVWNACSMEEAFDEEWREGSDVIYTSTQSFIDKFADTANDDGYILVTDEVKAALKQINAVEDEDWEWLWLCCTREQSGVTYDYDAYDEAYEKYDEATERITMRETLQDTDNAFAVNTLYCYNDGVLSTIRDNVLSAEALTGSIIFNTSDLIYETMNIEDITSASEVNELFWIDYESRNYLVSTEGTTVYQMSENAAEIFDDIRRESYVQLYIIGTDVYMNEHNGEIFSAKVSDGVVGDFDIIADDASIYDVDGTTIYYMSSGYSSDDNFYCDLYSYSNGKSKRLAQDVILSDVNLYSDGVVLGYTDYSNNFGYELTMFAEDGKITIISDDVTQYIRLDDSEILYISDNDLYLYNGKEKSMIKNDVDFLWSRKSMDISRTFGGSNQ